MPGRTKTLTAKELAEEFKRRLVELTWLSPDYMYVLTDVPNEKGMTAESHGWSGNPDAVELVVEEAYVGIERVAEGFPECHGRWDYVKSCVLEFYEEEC